ncbi:Predicted dehydrogenase [Natronoarchaeum philippinense]|uniref:Predicted dehydrogenase n=1 Tax=Natronoarchaeum philippinense TaxID=558529 RepID=A0A285N0L6_NATPI|nr:Gfo/Idh/MocA family oxidoreductase [Natronoarchaeum philippinense]SNZ02989.1 Predicted dehydrogenase [Natronoarchaeum philippinense]
MTVRIAGIGLGGLGLMELEAFASMEGVEVVAGADPSVAARDRFIEAFAAPVYETTEELLAAHDDLGAASIASVHAGHFEQAAACIEAGLDVHVEKPMVTTVDEAVALVDAADEHGALVQVGYQRHVDPYYVELRRLIEAGAIGTPRMAHCHLQQDWLRDYAEGWQGDPELSGGGFLYDSGSHLMDVLPWALAAEPSEVAALTDDRGEGAEIDAAISAHLERDDGIVTASVGVCGDGTQTPDVDDGLTVYGTEGSLHYDGDELVRVDRGGDELAVEIDGDADFETLTRVKLENFVGAIRGEEELAAPPEDGLRAIAFTEAAVRAADRGETVDAQELIDAARAR